MEVIFVLIPISLVIVFGSIFIFLWAVNNYQFDDLDKEAQRILQDDAEPASRSIGAAESIKTKMTDTQIVAQKPGGSL